uniref:Transposase domain-containing protein n=1 Tax=Rhizophagus irregularis (strain DAOM 181602 / DAOM 197198 / MUCL 43194) TaxID=747089 RepID=U9UIQ0_RHIID
MLFPVLSLKTQIISMYQRPGFVESLQKWTNWVNIANLYTDIYDGKVWKTFPSSLDNLDTQFFTNETADSNLGIMINLDWFQPFNSSAYSSGPEEVKLHKINHYLSPIVDELLEFWDGVDLPSTDLHPTALVGCHRCYKIANISGRKLNYGGFDDMTEWFVQIDLNEHRRNAERWRLCKSKYERKKHVSETHVRWSELLRLPYFNPIRFLVVDPMHNLFLGIAHWIVKRLWIDGGKITKTHLKLMEKRAKKIQVPVDLGRIPSKIATGEGFSGYTADQWRSFIMIYATPIMWDLLDEADRKILANFLV